MTKLRLIYRSYGGENLKNRPPFYSKALTLASFVVAGRNASDAEMVFINDGPVPAERLRLMERHGRVIQIADAPVGMRDSYRFGLALPDREGWSDDDVVSFNEDDYLFHRDAFVALAAASESLPTVSYFSLNGDRPEDPEPHVARIKYALPRDWHPQPDLKVDDEVWFNMASTASTFSARVGALRRDLPIFHQCMIPFRRRYLDHETCLIYQGYVPYRGREIILGLPSDFEPTARGVVRTAFLIPFRLALNTRAKRQHRPHLLYAPQSEHAAHMEIGLMGTEQDWVAVAHDTYRWTEEAGFHDLASTIRARLAPDG